MIKYALQCHACGMTFEGWFASSSAYDDQQANGDVACPACNSTDTAKQIMAPAIGRSSKQAEFAKEMRAFAAKARKHVAENYDYVGDSFADEARAMYYGETDSRPIWGETKREDAEALAEEGVPAAPLPKSFAPIPPKPDKQIN